MVGRTGPVRRGGAGRSALPHVPASAKKRPPLAREPFIKADNPAALEIKSSRQDELTRIDDAERVR